MAATRGKARLFTRRGLLVLAACLLSGCAQYRVSRPPADSGQERQVRLAVPFFPDDTDQCGPSVLASVLGYWGKPEKPEALRGEIYRPRLKGSLTVDLLLAAESRGLAAEIINAGLDRVRTELDAGRPLIAFVDAGYRFYPSPHYLVITGYDDRRQCVYAHSGARRDQRISYAKLKKEWKKTEEWALSIQPRRPL
jgi:ABC-type bacteriocin/lantibiotic exporter with double-glycine peptidase domain